MQLDLITNATSGPCYDCYRTNSEAIIELIHQKILEYWASYYGLEGRTTQHHHLITRAGCYHYPTGGGAYPLECFFDITACCYKNFNITMDNYGNITSYTADGMGAYAYPPGYEATCTSEHDPGYNSCFILCGIVAGLNLFVTHPKQSVASDEFNIQAKSTDNSSDNYSINVYNGHLVIKSNCSNQQDVNITMTDYLGNVVFNTASNYKPNSEKSFKLPFLYNGIYLINLNNTNYSTSKKISILN